jgi:hypothetical protein
MDKNLNKDEKTFSRSLHDNTGNRPNTPKLPFYMAMIFVFMFVAWFIFYFFHWYLNMGETKILYERFAAVVGIPLAMCAAFVVVAILEQTSGPIEVHAPGFSVKGAAGQVLF